MQGVLTDVFIWNLRALVNEQPRYIVNEGGSGSSKTRSLLQIKHHILENYDPGSLCSVVSESLPHLKKGAQRDWQSILGDAWNEKAWNASEHTYKIGTGFLEFFSAEPGKGTGPRRDYLFVNEAINVSWEVFAQLRLRTNKTIFIDYNPQYEFWVHEKILPPPHGSATHGEKVVFIHSTYKDAIDHVTRKSVLPEAIVRVIESLQGDERTIYLEGKLGSLEGRIYQFNTCASVPPEARLLAYGIDFGFSNDETVVQEIWQWNGGHVVNQLVYELGLTNPDLWDKVRERIRHDVPAYADSAEPKSIEELKRLGWRRIQAATKGPDSVRQGIQTVQSYPLTFTVDSVESIKEARNYFWKKKDGEPVNEPVGVHNAMDALRYPVQTIFTKPKRVLYLAD